ncbi:MAG: hypothetical protein PHX43_03910 [Alphaproteobacteria bacterium]|nr:hypothetical protein [Alphaproteobacteria bacterium]
MTVYVVLGRGYVCDCQHTTPETEIVNVHSSKEKAEEYIKSEGADWDEVMETFVLRKEGDPNNYYYDRYEYDIQEEEVL